MYDLSNYEKLRTSIRKITDKQGLLCSLSTTGLYKCHITLKSCEFLDYDVTSGFFRQENMLWARCDGHNDFDLLCLKYDVS